MDFTPVQGILGVVLTVSVIIATTVVGLMIGSVRTLRETATDLRNRVGDLEKERVEDKTRIAKLDAENAMLRRIVTGEVHWQSLTDLLEHHHTEAQTHWQEAHRSLDAILAELRGATA